MSANNSRLVVQNLQKSFKKRQVVKSFSLEIESGEVIGLLGPNGAGKTTSFYMIVGLIAADAGSVLRALWLVRAGVALWLLLAGLATAVLR